MKAKKLLLEGLNGLKGLWNASWKAASLCAPCCGIRLDRELRRSPEIVGTAGKCCGVRM